MADSSAPSLRPVFNLPSAVPDHLGCSAAIAAALVRHKHANAAASEGTAS